jgi:predicted HAD superfamily Cof-like phosphohydrolase
MPITRPQDLVREFHTAFNLPVRDTPQADGIDSDERALRTSLVLEEMAELVCAMWGYGDERKLADAFAGAVRDHAFAQRRQGQLDGLPVGGLVPVARECADVLTVVYGTALHYGFDLDAAMVEVTAANMRKLGPEGKPVYQSKTKVLKPPGWEPPDVAAAIGVKARAA